MLEDCAIRFTDFDLLFVVVVVQLTSDPAAVFPSSAPPVHSSLTKNSILLDPKAFSGLEDEGIPASDFLEWLEVEVCQVVAR